MDEDGSGTNIIKLVLMANLALEPSIAVVIKAEASEDS